MFPTSIPYKARATINPPTIAIPPDTTFPAALVVGVAAAEGVELGDPEGVGVLDTTTEEVETMLEELLEVVEALELEEVVETIEELLLLCEEVVDAVYFELLVILTVVVLVALPVAELELVLVRPEMWNGKLYWKMVSSASRESLKP